MRFVSSRILPLVRAPRGALMVRHLSIALLLAASAGLTACEPDPAACCRADGECAEGAVCREGHCTPKCQDTSQCYGGQTCLSGACVFVGRPVSQCGFDFIDEPATGVPDVVEPDAQPGVNEPDGTEPDVQPGPFEPEGVPEPEVTPEPGEPEPFEPDPFEPEPVEPDPGPNEPGTEPDPEPGPIPGCIPDTFEPNDRRNQASVIDFDVDYFLSICGEDDQDFFLFELQPGETLVARIDFTDSVGDLDMALFRQGTQNPVETSNSTQDFERIVHTTNQGGRFFLRVLGFSGQEGPYQLQASLTDGPLCEQDANEPNDSFFDATPIEPFFPRLGAFCEPGEVDVFALFPAEPTAFGFVEFFSFGGPGLFLVVVYDSAGAEIGLQETEGGAIIEIDGQDIPPGPIFVEVLYLEGPPGFRPEYELFVNLEPGEQQCGEDDFEPNDTFAQASPVPPQEAVEGAICEFDVDIFEFDFDSGDARLIINSFDQELTVFVRDRDFNIQREYFGSFIIDTFPIDPTGEFFVELFAFDAGGESTTYTLIAEPD